MKSLINRANLWSFELLLRIAIIRQKFQEILQSFQLLIDIDYFLPEVIDHLCQHLADIGPHLLA